MCEGSKFGLCDCFQRVTPDMAEFLQKLKTRVRVGVVGGSDLSKIKEQLGNDGETHSMSVFACSLSVSAAAAASLRFTCFYTSYLNFPADRIASLRLFSQRDNKSMCSV